MNVEIFTPVVYYGPETTPNVPAPPRLFDPAFGRESMECGFQQCEAAFEAGFDSLNFAEHHYSTSQLSPNPIFYAGVLGERLPTAKISVLGTDLPIVNPVRAAEEYCMLDNLLGGRLRRIGLLRGTPNEYFTYGTNPWESRERFDEGALLFKRALIEPEPFGWEGRYYRFRNVAVWPHPFQDPHPPILLSGNSRSSAEFAGRHGFDIGFSFQEADAAAANLAVYREAAAEAGWEPTAENILYRAFCLVAESDEEASRIVEETRWPNGPGLFAAATPDMMMLMATTGAAMAGAPKGVPLDPSKGGPPKFSAPIVGGPETVLARIAALHEAIGMGSIEFIVAGTSGSIDHDGVVRSIKVMGETIVPGLHAETFAVGG